MAVEKVYLELTNRCNLNCTMCYRKAWNEKTYDMKPEVVNKCIHEIKSIDSIREVVLGGIGEPTFFEGIIEVIRALKDKKITLTTNGTILTKALLDVLVQAVDHIIISIDGMSDVFYQIRHFSLDQIIQHIRKLNEYKKQKGTLIPNVSFQMVVSKENADQIKGIIDLADLLEVPQVILSNILPSTLADNHLVLYKRYENKELSQIFKEAQRYAFRKGIELKLPEVQLKTERRCRFVDENSTFITVSGEVVPCYRFSHDGSEVIFGRLKEIKAHSFGNIMSNRLEEIWNHQSYVAYREIVHNNHYPSCTDCDLVDGCDMVRNAELDCYGNMPSCADCIWSRRLIYCI